jgi:hypothetical protein
MRGYIYQNSKVYSVGISPILPCTSYSMIQLYKSSRIQYCIVHCIYLLNQTENPEVVLYPYCLEISTNKQDIVRSILQYLHVPNHNKIFRIELNNLSYSKHSLLFLAFCTIYNKSKKYIPILGSKTRLNIVEFVCPKLDIHTKMSIWVLCTRAIESCFGCAGLFQFDWIHYHIVVSPLAYQSLLESKKRKRCVL